MDPRTRVMPLVPNELTFISSRRIPTGSTRDLKSTKRKILSAFDVVLENQKELIANKFLRAQYKAVEFAINSPKDLIISIKSELREIWEPPELRTELRTLKTPMSYAAERIRRQILELGKDTIADFVSNLKNVVTREGKIVKPGIDKALDKIFRDMVVTNISAPPYFKGDGLSDAKMEQIKSKVMDALIGNIE